MPKKTYQELVNEVAYLKQQLKGCQAEIKRVQLNYTISVPLEYPKKVIERDFLAKVVEELHKKELIRFDISEAIEIPLEGWNPGFDRCRTYCVKTDFYIVIKK